MKGDYIAITEVDNGFILHRNEHRAITNRGSEKVCFVAKDSAELLDKLEELFATDVGHQGMAQIATGVGQMFENDQ
jgi:hypothetical protein